MSFVQVISVALVLAFAVEGIGRKKCLIIGGLGQGAMMLWLGGFTKLHPSSGIVPASYVSIVAVYLYAVFYCVGWGPLPWVVAGEVAPNHLRTGAMSVAIGVNWFVCPFLVLTNSKYRYRYVYVESQRGNADHACRLFSFTISKLTPIMLNSIKYGTFLLFGFCCLTMAVWAYVCLPETTGYALEDIHLLFEDEVILRAVGDAPGGRLFLGGRRAKPVGKQAREREVKGDLEEGEDEKSGSRVDGESEKETEKKGLGEVDVI